jgi:hypothetical protein
MQCFFRPIRIIPILALLTIDIPGSPVKHHEFSRRPLSQAGSGHGIALVAFITFIIVIPAAPWHHKLRFVMRAIVVYRDVLVSASDRTLLMRHFGGRIVKNNNIVNNRCFYANHHRRGWVLRLLDLTFDCSKNAFIHPLMAALR